ncbi:hypothetical protein ACFLZ4_02175 [Patescibacteria group bacterium]
MVTNKLESADSLNQDEIVDSDAEDVGKETTLSDSNQEIMNSLPKRGRLFAEKVFENPLINRPAAKLAIAYDNFLIDKHQKKANTWEKKMGDADEKIKEFDTPRQTIEEALKDLEDENKPGVAGLRAKLTKINSKVGKLNVEKNGYKEKYVERQKKNKEFIETRDTIAGKLVKHYDEKLKPIERGVEEMTKERNEADLLITVTEIEHEEFLSKIKEAEEKKIKLENALATIGESRRSIRRETAVVTRGEEIKESKDNAKKILKNIEEMKKELIKADEKIDRQVNKAKPFKEQRKAFENIITGKTQDDSERQEDKKDAFTIGVLIENAFNENSKRKSEEEKETFKLEDALKMWNELVSKSYTGNSKAVADYEHLLKTTGLSSSGRISIRSLGKLLKKYFNLFGLLGIEVFPSES